ncbi:MAG: multiheme c-type cytochrome [Deferrisomatales bacterium]
MKFPFLSANLRDAKGKHVFSPYLLRTLDGLRIGIFGLADGRLKLDKVPGGDRLQVQDPLDAAAVAVRELKAQGAAYVILLTDMTGRSLRKLALKGLPIDLIVGSDERNQIALPILLGNSYVTHLDRGGKSIGRLELTFLEPGEEGPAGGLRTRSRPGGDVAYQNTFVPLRLAMPEHPVLGPLVAEVARKVAAAQEEVSKKTRAAENSECGKRYLGAAACAGCHADRDRGWRATSHARAYDTLVKKKKQFDEDCLACHTLGFECEGGFFDPANLGGFAHVQCESCHGPGQAHVEAKGKAPVPVARPGAGVCHRCHTDDKSPEFRFAATVGSVCRAVP